MFTKTSKEGMRLRKPSESSSVGQVHRSFDRRHDVRKDQYASQQNVTAALARSEKLGHQICCAKPQMGDRIQRLKEGDDNVNIQGLDYDKALELRMQIIQQMNEANQNLTFEPDAETELRRVDDRVRELEPGQDEVRIPEMWVTRVAADKPIRYPGITSCITVTVWLDNGEKIGGHAALMAPPGLGGPDLIKSMVSLMREGDVANQALIKGVGENWSTNLRSAIDIMIKGETMDEGEELIETIEGLRPLVSHSFNIPEDAIEAKEVYNGGDVEIS